MYYLALLFGGATIGLMISVNGQLANHLNIFEISFIVHGIGLMLLLTYAVLIKRERITFRGLPKYVYTVGIYGVILVVTGSICANKIGATLTMGLSIVGQMLISAVIDHFGLFKTPVCKFDYRRIPGYLIIGAGILLLLR
ncbi:MAG: DMT family transporter [Clostridium sp.]